MEASQSPFPAAWWGTELPGVRPPGGTYGRYDYAPIAKPSDVSFDGTFNWLRAEPARGDNIIDGKGNELSESFARLDRFCGKRAIALPESFRVFFRSDEPASRVRSCTACFLDLAEDATDSPKGSGRLVRFLSDQQGCVFWYLYLDREKADHCVVASPDYFGSDAEEIDAEPGDPESIAFSAESFESFVFRFWMENEFWYATSGGTSPPSALAQRSFEAQGWRVPTETAADAKRRSWWSRVFGKRG